MNIYITIGGQGSRLKSISPVDKYNLYFKDKKIIDWIKCIFPSAKLLGEKKTNSRKETLMEIQNESDVLIIDCDVIPIDIDLSKIRNNCDNVFIFESKINKWGSAKISKNTLIDCSESENISSYKLSGVYYIKNMKNTLSNMKNENSIGLAMIGANIILENSFIRLGDVDDYFRAILSC
jgi:hypothetical protein